MKNILISLLIQKELNFKFSEDYKEQRCLTSDAEINNWIDNKKFSQ